MPCFLTSEQGTGTAVVDRWDDASGRYLYRYHLTRHFCEGEGSVAFIMLNPSKADHHRDDQSVRRCITFARAWRFQTLVVGNLYARYTTVPKELKNVSDPIGRLHNDHYLRCIAAQCDKVVAAWGNQGIDPLGEQDFRNRANEVLLLLWRAMAQANRPQRIDHLVSKWTKGGYPLHPERLPSGTQSEEWMVENPPPQIRPPPR